MSRTKLNIKPTISNGYDTVGDAIDNSINDAILENTYIPVDVRRFSANKSWTMTGAMVVNVIPVQIRDSIRVCWILEKEVSSIEARLRRFKAYDTGSSDINCTNYLSWDTKQNVRKSLRFILATRAFWLHVRSSVKTAVNEVSNLLHWCESGFSSSYDGSFSFSGYSSSGEAIALAATKLKAKTVDPYVAELTAQIVNKFNDLMQRAEAAYNQSEATMALPDYVNIRKLLTHNGRRAYSLAMLFKTGRLDKYNPPDKKFLGWCIGGAGQVSHDQDRVYETVRAYVKLLRFPVESDVTIEKPIKPPSVSDGRQIIRYTYRYKERASSVTSTYDIVNRDMPYTDRPKADRINRILTNNSLLRIFLDRCLLSGRHYEVSPSMLMTVYRYAINTAKEAGADASVLLRSARTDGDYIVSVPKFFRVQNNIAKRIGIDPDSARSIRDNSVTTLLTGDVQRLQGDDYIAPCMYTEENKTRRGYVLMRKGWPDCYHATEDEIPISLDTDGTGSMHPHFLNVQWIQDKLDRASFSHFDYKRRCAENSKQRARTTNQRRADVLRALRKLPLLTRDDSYAAGNCNPGTESFINTLQLLSGNPDRKEISGRELAINWRKRQYPELERLTNVTRYLFHEAEEKAKREAEERAKAEVLAKMDEALLDQLGVDRMQSESPAVHQPDVDE